MKKRILSLVLVFSILSTLVASLPIIGSANTDISIGQYVQMGAYYGEPILWRCVDIDENGPLILSDKIICLKTYDAGGGNESGSHGRGGEKPYGYGNGLSRTANGSNYWGDSNIRDWLNSTDSAGGIH